MRKMILIAVVAAASVCMAQDDEAPLRNAMKQIGPTNGALGKKIGAKDASASAEAEKLQALFVDVRKFWEGRSTADAVEFAKNANEQFGQVAKLISAGQWEDAAASQKKAGANCMGCHSAHREKAEGGWKIK